MLKVIQNILYFLPSVSKMLPLFSPTICLMSEEDSIGRDMIMVGFRFCLFSQLTKFEKCYPSKGNYSHCYWPPYTLVAIKLQKCITSREFNKSDFVHSRKKK